MDLTRQETERIRTRRAIGRVPREVVIDDSLLPEPMRNLTKPCEINIQRKVKRHQFLTTQFSGKNGEYRGRGERDRQIQRERGMTNDLKAPRTWAPATVGPTETEEMKQMRWRQAQARESGWEPPQEESHDGGVVYDLTLLVGVGIVLLVLGYVITRQ